MTEGKANLTLDDAALAYHDAKDNFEYAKKEFEWAKATFIRFFEAEYGDVGSYAASDGNTYGRIAKTVGGGFDFDRFLKEHPAYAKLVSKRVLDQDALQAFVEAHEDLRPIVAEYAIPGTTQLALSPVKATKEEVDE